MFSPLTGLFTEDQVPWLLEMLRNDVFGGAEKISRDHFMTIRGHSPDKNAFWRQVSQIAVEKFNMQEVFNMRSTVRLTAIEKLCECVSSSLWWSLPCRYGWLAVITVEYNTLGEFSVKFTVCVSSFYGNIRSRSVVSSDISIVSPL